MPPTLPWMIALGAGVLLLAVLLVLSGLWAWRRRQRRPEPLPTQWALSARPVFSTDERKVYRHLREALPHHIVLAKVPLVRFSQAVDPQQRGYWYRLLGSKHVTFAICSSHGRVLIAIDFLDDYESVPTRERTIKENVLAACKVRYLRIARDDPPSAPELQLLLPPTAGGARAPNPAPHGGLAPSPAIAVGVTRRRDRRALWQDSGFFQDSFFGPERAETGASSEYGTLGQFLRDGVPARDRAEPPPGDRSAPGPSPR